jgi:hypothetical protein
LGARRAALQRKAQGARLGNRTNAARAAALGRRAQAEQARQFAANVLPVIESIKRSGVSTFARIAEALTARGLRSARGGEWHVSGVQRVLAKWSFKTFFYDGLKRGSLTSAVDRNIPNVDSAVFEDMLSDRHRPAADRSAPTRATSVKRPREIVRKDSGHLHVPHEPLRDFEYLARLIVRREAGVVRRSFRRVRSFRHSLNDFQLSAVCPVGCA